MRKDLRIGLGIGALLLVFTITFLVVRNHTENQARLAGEQGELTDRPEIESGLPEANPNTVTLNDTASNRAATLPPIKPVTSVDPATPPLAVKPAAEPDPFDPRPLPQSGGGVSGSSISNTSQDWDMILATGRMGSGGMPGTGSTGGAPHVPIHIVPPRNSGSSPHVVLPPRTSTQRSSEGGASPRPMVGGGTLSVATGRPYTIKEGDTFVTIAKSAYGNSRYYLQIEKANSSVDPTRLKIGQQIVLPELSSEARSVKEPTGPFHESDNRPINNRTEYRVDTGDSLYRISMRIYGTPRMIDAIYDANKSTIGANPERLRLGMILKLPPALAQASK